MMSPFTTTNVPSIAGVLGRESDRTCRVERFGLDRVVEPRPWQRPSGNASRKGSALNPSASVTSVTPPSTRRPTRREIIGSWPTGSIDFGTWFVSGRIRVPKPPTSTTARIRAST